MLAYMLYRLPCVYQMTILFYLKKHSSSLIALLRTKLHTRYDAVAKQINLIYGAGGRWRTRNFQLTEMATKWFD